MLNDDKKIQSNLFNPTLAKRYKLMLKCKTREIHISGIRAKS